MRGDTVTATTRHFASRCDADGITADQLREVALQLRRHAATHARTEAEVMAFLDRADEIRAEARVMDEHKQRCRLGRP